MAEGTAESEVRAGRARLLDTAEQLLDEHGIDGVSMRTVTSASGHRNASAINYHFGSRVELIRAVLDRRRGEIEQRRSQLLDQIEAAGDVTPRKALTAAMQPMIERLGDPTGRRYIRLLFQASVHPAFANETGASFSATIARARPYVLPLTAHLSPDRAEVRMRTCMSWGVMAIAHRARFIDDPDPNRTLLDEETFASDLLDAIVAALSA
jgi:AcrR family transcriptional regulator